MNTADFEICFLCNLLQMRDWMLEGLAMEILVILVVILGFRY